MLRIASGPDFNCKTGKGAITEFVAESGAAAKPSSSVACGDDQHRWLARRDKSGRTSRARASWISRQLSANMAVSLKAAPSAVYGPITQGRIAHDRLGKSYRVP